MPLPLVVIAGRPNVGKSTLFNRLVGRRVSIVSDEPGVTRDRLYGVVHSDRSFRIVDTGGLGAPRSEPLAASVERQVGAALEEAHLVLFVVDARVGATPLDEVLAEQMRRRNRPVLLVANKVDVPSVEALVPTLFSLGLGQPLAVSAEHGGGFEELLSAIEATLPPDSEAKDGLETETLLSLAIVGRPNVGKSSLLNCLLGEERALVSEVPGTTRDSTDTLLDLGGRRFRLIDTAGLRRPGRVVDAVEQSSVARAKRNIERADVVLLVLDAVAGWSAQDAHIAGHALDGFRPLLVAVNKWDLVPEREQAVKTWEDLLRQRLRFAHDAPLVFLSARTGQRVQRVLDLALQVHSAAGIRVGTGELNRWLREQSPGDKGPRDGLRLLYATQIGVRPPSFVVFCNDPRHIHFSMSRRLENSLRGSFGFASVPIRLTFRGRREGGR